jgi:iron(III) transport system ATP-binding protein
VKIEIQQLTKRYGSVVAVNSLDLTVSEGELLVLLGPSGCGKTTTMRAIVGLEEPDSGRILVGDSVVYDATRAINVPPHRRQMGMVFQSYAIWPHKSVFQNVSYPLERQGIDRAAIVRRVAEALELVGLTGYGERGASLLSGGQMQRVALARSIVGRPRVLLLDEPLSNLDARLRDHLRFELRDIQQRLGITAVYVTHDQSEALALADRIAVMRDGVIVQLADPLELYRHPASIFVADFLGVGNILPGNVVTQHADGTCALRLDPGATMLRATTRATIGARVHACVRPEHLVLSATAPEEGDARPLSVMRVQVEVATFLGNQVRYQVDCGGQFKLSACANADGGVFPRGAALYASILADNVQILDH